MLCAQTASGVLRRARAIPPAHRGSARCPSRGLTRMPWAQLSALAVRSRFPLDDDLLRQLLRALGAMAPNLAMLRRAQAQRWAWDAGKLVAARGDVIRADCGPRLGHKLVVHACDFSARHHSCSRDAAQRFQLGPKTIRWV